jgi:hypothetical protein
MRWAVRQHYENFVTGVKWTRVLPRSYRTWRGADAAAARLNWTTMPNPSTRIDGSRGEVIEKWRKVA